MATRYRSRRARLAALSDSLRAQGQTWAQIATRIAREEHVNMRVGFRLAHGMSQREVAARWNEEFPTETGSASMADKVISYWETWPQSGYEPSVQLHQPDLAEAALTDALRQNLSVRRRGSVLTDLAILGAQRRDLDRMITYADAVVEMVRQTGSGVIARKLTGLQSHLALFSNDVRVRDLNSRIATLAGNVTGA